MVSGNTHQRGNQHRAFPSGEHPLSSFNIFAFFVTWHSFSYWFESNQLYQPLRRILYLFKICSPNFYCALHETQDSQWSCSCFSLLSHFVFSHPHRLHENMNSDKPSMSNTPAPNRTNQKPEWRHTTDTWSNKPHTVRQFWGCFAGMERLSPCGCLHLYVGNDLIGQLRTQNANTQRSTQPHAITTVMQWNYIAAQKWTKSCESQCAATGATVFFWFSNNSCQAIYTHHRTAEWRCLAQTQSIDKTKQ